MKGNNEGTIAILIGCVGVLIWLGIAGGLLWAAVHFIRKFW